MPYSSKSQMRAFFAMEADNELPKGTARHWAHATKRQKGGIKALPERVGSAKQAEDPFAQSMLPDALAGLLGDSPLNMAPVDLEARALLAQIAGVPPGQQATLGSPPPPRARFQQGDPSVLDSLEEDDEAEERQLSAMQMLKNAFCSTPAGQAFLESLDHSFNSSLQQLKKGVSPCGVSSTNETTAVKTAADSQYSSQNHSLGAQVVDSQHTSQNHDSRTQPADIEALLYGAIYHEVEKHGAYSKTAAKAAKAASGAYMAPYSSKGDNLGAESRISSYMALYSGPQTGQDHQAGDQGHQTDPGPAIQSAQPLPAAAEKRAAIQSLSDNQLIGEQSQRPPEPSTAYASEKIAMNDWYANGGRDWYCSKCQHGFDGKDSQCPRCGKECNRRRLRSAR